MRLFKNKPRSHTGPGRRSETTYAFLDRSARDTSRNVRELLDVWFSHYPAEDQRELATRFRNTFDDAFFELLLHEVQLRLGFTLRTHPDVPGTSRKPDFLGLPNSGEPHYLEAAVVTESSDTERQEQDAHNRVIDALDTFSHPDFFFGVAHMEGLPSRMPATKTLHRLLTQCVDGLALDDVVKRFTDGFGSLPRRRLVHAGMTIEVYAVPKSAASQGKTGLRAIGLGPPRGGIVRSAEALRAVVKRKAKAYGTPDLPLIVAVNTVGAFGAERDDVLAALFGTEAVFDYGRGKEPVFGRQRDGVWTGGSSPTYTRLSAVLVASPVYPWNLADAPLRLYHNPWAARPYAGPLNQLPQFRVREGRPDWIEGVSLAALLDIPTGLAGSEK